MLHVLSHLAFSEEGSLHQNQLSGKGEEDVG
jgi:hypothetical protein